MRTLALLTLILSFVAVSLALVLESEIRDALQAMAQAANDGFHSAERMNEVNVLRTLQEEGPNAEVMRVLAQLTADAIRLRDTLDAAGNKFTVTESHLIVEEYGSFSDSQTSFINALVEKATLLDKVVHIGPSFPPRFTSLRLAIDELSQVLVHYLVPFAEKSINEGKQAMLSGLDIAIKMYTPIVQLTQ